MAFTAGSVEQAKALKLANQLSERYQKFGANASSGYTGAVKIENLAKKLGFGITGLTTGSGFPPFGSAGLTANVALVKLAAALQNTAGVTRPNGITAALFGNGATVGIYLRKFVRSGEDTTVTNSAVGAVAGTTFERFGGGNIVNGGYTACVFFGGAAGSTGTIS